MTPLLHFHVASRLGPRRHARFEKDIPKYNTRDEGKGARWASELLCSQEPRACPLARTVISRPWPQLRVTPGVVTMAQARGYFIYIYPFLCSWTSRLHPSLGILNNAAMNLWAACIFLNHVLLWIYAPDICPGMGLLDHMVTLFSGIKGPSTMFSVVNAPTYIPTNI